MAHPFSDWRQAISLCQWKVMLSNHLSSHSGLWRHRCLGWERHWPLITSCCDFCGEIITRFCSLKTRKNMLPSRLGTSTISWVPQYVSWLLVSHFWFPIFYCFWSAIPCGWILLTSSLLKSLDVEFNLILVFMGNIFSLAWFCFSKRLRKLTHRTVVPHSPHPAFLLYQYPVASRFCVFETTTKEQ